MSISPFKTFASGEILTASDLNSSFTQITSNGMDLVFPATEALDLDAFELIFDADADTSITADTDDQLDYKLNGTDYFRMIAGRFTAVAARIAEAEGAAVASAATTNIWVDDGNTVHITGTTTITSFGTAPQAGARQWVIFDGALTLTHGANLSLPGSANITTAANDMAMVYADTTTQFDVLYFKADGGAIAAGAASTLTGTTLAANVVSSSLTSLGTITSLVATSAAISGGTITGITDLVVGDGGTGVSTFTDGGVLLGNGTGPVQATSAGTAGQVFVSGGAGVDGSFRGIALIQRVVTLNAAVATGTTVTPKDDSIPQITEGDEYMTRAITPTATTNRLVIEVVVNVANSGASGGLTLALHQDATANALAAVTRSIPSADLISQLKLTHEMAAGTTSSTTFRVRVGGTANTTTFNGQAGARLMGGVMASSIVITEIAA